MVKDIEDFPIATLADTMRTKFMELYAKRRKKMVKSLPATLCFQL